jgi:hypothetical protein
MICDDVCEGPSAINCPERGSETKETINEINSTDEDFIVDIIFMDC